MLDEKISAAWIEAASELGVRVVAPYAVTLGDGTTLEVEAFLPDFGGPSGTIAVSLDDARRCRLAVGTRYFSSQLAPSYRKFDAGLFRETLEDWGWFGSGERRPSWFTGL